jgi:hypothetical protein
MKSFRQWLEVREEEDLTRFNNFSPDSFYDTGDWNVPFIYGGIGKPAFVYGTKWNNHKEISNSSAARIKKFCGVTYEPCNRDAMLEYALLGRVGNESHSTVGNPNSKRIVAFWNQSKDTYDKLLMGCLQNLIKHQWIDENSVMVPPFTVSPPRLIRDVVGGRVPQGEGVDPNKVYTIGGANFTVSQLLKMRESLHTKNPSNIHPSVNSMQDILSFLCQIKDEDITGLKPTDCSRAVTPGSNAFYSQKLTQGRSSYCKDLKKYFGSPEAEQLPGSIHNPTQAQIDTAWDYLQNKCRSSRV